MPSSASEPSPATINAPSPAIPTPSTIQGNTSGSDNPKIAAPIDILATAEATAHAPNNSLRDALSDIPARPLKNTVGKNAMPSPVTEAPIAMPAPPAAQESEGTKNVPTMVPTPTAGIVD